MKVSAAILALSCAFFAHAEESRAFQVPGSIPQSIIAHIKADQKNFDAELASLVAADHEGLLVLVDKKHPLAADFVPSDLVPLASDRAYSVGKKGLELRAPAETGLAWLAASARKDGVSLVASSTYRSYSYQKKVYERIVGEMGQKAADRESARAGTSQHQTGTAVDFGSITDDFAGTKAGKWLAANAEKNGWSLSFPNGYESVTGYRWECWHYRYIGVEAAAFQKKWFGDIQQYMMEYIDAWKAARR